MINKKWLIASVFIPIIGTVINLFLLYSYYYNQKERVFPKRLFLCGLLCGVTLLIVFVVSGLLLGFIDEVAGLNIPSNLGMILAFIIAGLAMNIVFVIFYSKALKENDDKKQN